MSNLGPRSNTINLAEIKQNLQLYYSYNFIDGLAIFIYSEFLCILV